MRLALALSALLVPSLALAASTSDIAERLRAEASSRQRPVVSTDATSTSVTSTRRVGSSSSTRVLADRGCTSVARPSCESRGVLMEPNTRRITTYRGGSNWDSRAGCDQGRSSCGTSSDWSRGGCASTTRSCGGSDSGIVVIGPTVIVVSGGGSTGSWISSPACTTRSTGTWGWGGSASVSRPADIRVSWQATGGGR